MTTARVALFVGTIGFLTLAFWMMRSGVDVRLVSPFGVVFFLVCIAADVRLAWLCAIERGVDWSVGVLTVAFVGWYLFALVGFALLPSGEHLIAQGPVPFVSK